MEAFPFCIRGKTAKVRQKGCLIPSFFKMPSTVIGHISAVSTPNTCPHITDDMQAPVATKIDPGIEKQGSAWISKAKKQSQRQQSLWYVQVNGETPLLGPSVPKDGFCVLDTVLLRFCLLPLFSPCFSCSGSENGAKLAYLLTAVAERCSDRPAKRLPLQIFSVICSQRR